MDVNAARRSFAVWFSGRRSLPYKLRRSLLKKLDPAMLRDYAFEAPFYSPLDIPAEPLRFRGNIASYIDRLIYFTGAHEKYMLSLLRDYALALRAGCGNAALVYMDVGANAGNHTLFMSRLADRVLAFEPFERVRRQMEENLALNEVRNVTVFPFALSHANQALPFYAAEESNLGASSFAEHHRKGSRCLGDMQLRIGDEVLAEAGVASVNILKVDVEGFEKPVLEGLSATITRSRPLMVVELTATTRDSIGCSNVFRALFPSDYQFYCFTRGNSNSGAYRLARYRYGMTPRIEDVIACPDEHVRFLLHVDKHALFSL